MRRRVAIGVACVVLAVVVGVCVWRVNANALTFPVREYDLQEDVALDGAFAEYAYENTEGYSLRVTGARRMSVDEYFGLYGQDEQGETTYRENAPREVGSPDAALIVLDIEIRNDKAADDDKGYLDSIGWALQSEQKPEYWIRVESGVFNCSIPQVEGSYKLSIKPGTTFTLHVPFRAPSVPSDFPAPAGTFEAPPLEAGAYSFVITKAPVRNVVKFDVT